MQSKANTLHGMVPQKSAEESQALYSKRKGKIENALNEARILVLLVQVLLGFELQGVFQNSFAQASTQAQYVKLAGLCSQLIAFTLFLAPASYHQWAERGELHPRLQKFISTVVCYGLLPFALAMGIDLAFAVRNIVGPVAADLISLSAVLAALFFWYGLGFLARDKDKASEGRDEGMSNGSNRISKASTEGTPLSDKIKFVLTETRVVLPGTQALIGFQLAAILMPGFERLPLSLKQIHLVGLLLVAASAILLMAPAAFHRIAEQGEDTERLHRFATKMLLGAMALLAPGIAADIVVIFQKVTGSSSLAWTVAAVSLACFYGMWFGYTTVVRMREGERSSANVSSPTSDKQTRMPAL